MLTENSMYKYLPYQVGKMELGWCDTALVLPYAAIQILYPGIADRCLILWKKLNYFLALSPQVWP